MVVTHLSLVAQSDYSDSFIFAVPHTWGWQFSSHDPSLHNTIVFSYQREFVMSKGLQCPPKSTRVLNYPQNTHHRTVKKGTSRDYTLPQDVKQ